MLTNIKKIMGINNDEFDSIINMYIKSAELDLEMVGIDKSKIQSDDSLVNSAIISYVLSLLDTNNAELYGNAYSLQKDELRHIQEYSKGE